MSRDGILPLRTYERPQLTRVNRTRVACESGRAAKRAEGSGEKEKDREREKVACGLRVNAPLNADEEISAAFRVRRGRQTRRC